MIFPQLWGLHLRVPEQLVWISKATLYARIFDLRQIVDVIKILLLRQYLFAHVLILVDFGCVSQNGFQILVVNAILTIGPVR